MKKTIKLLLVTAVVVIIAVIVYPKLMRPHGILGNGTIKVSGNIEATEVRLSFRVAGKISELLVDEGYLVKAGDIVARLDTDELTKIKAQAQAALKAEEYAYKLAGEDYLRAENLFSAGSISAQKRDAAKTDADAAKANVEALRASLELADTRLSFVELASALDGFVLVKSAEVGEVVGVGATIFTVANLKDIWLTAYVNETDLGRVKLNQQVDIKTDSYPGKIYKGRISFISEETEFTPKQIQTNEERVKLVYRIKVTVDNPDLELKPGMPADGYIVE